MVSPSRTVHGEQQKFQSKHLVKFNIQIFIIKLTPQGRMRGRNEEKEGRGEMGIAHACSLETGV